MMKNVQSKGKVLNPYTFPFVDGQPPHPQTRSSRSGKENQDVNQQNCRPHDKPFAPYKKDGDDDFDQPFQLIT